MSLPTPAESAFAKQHGLEPAAVARARDVFNTIAALDWPLPERVSLLARIARGAKADVGTVLGGLALARAPLRSFEQLVAVDGLADKRVAGLARALAGADPKSFSQAAAGLLDAFAQLDALRSENAALRVELDRLLARQPQTGAGGEPVDERMRLSEVAGSVGEQITQTSRSLAAMGGPLRLSGVALELRGRATAIDADLGLDFAPAAGERSSVGLAFVPQRPGAAAAGGDTPVPDVAGYTPALAVRKLEGAGFAVVVTRVAGGSGHVATQNPAGGTAAPAGSTVRLIVR